MNYVEDDDEDNDYASEVSSAFSETLTKFKKKSPTKKGEFHSQRASSSHCVFQLVSLRLPMMTL